METHVSELQDGMTVAQGAVFVVVMACRAGIVGTATALQLALSATRVRWWPTVRRASWPIEGATPLPDPAPSSAWRSGPP